MRSGMRYTTNTDNELVDQLIHEFASQCNYVLNNSLERQLKQPAREAANLCKSMKVDPKTYVDAQVTFVPIIRGYGSLTPQQLCSKDSKRYVMDYIALEGDRFVDREFETECTMLSQCMDSGWSERLALLNSTFDFSPWFRILMASECDEELITQYGRLASQILNNDRDLVQYLKTIKTKEGKGLDFSRIPDFKL